MKKRKSRTLYAFLIPLAACAAFLVGAVKLWGIPAENMLSGLMTLLILVGGVLVLALLTVAVFKLIRRGRDD